MCPTCLGKLATPTAPPVVPVAQLAPPMSQPKKKKRVWLWVIVAIFVIGIFGNTADPQKTAAEVAAEKNEVARVAAEQKKQAAAEAKLKAEEARRGPMPKPSAWDGLTPEVNAFFKGNLKDYDSLKLVECSEVAMYGKDAWAQRVKYRAKNSFGGYNLSNQIFIIKDSQVIDVLGE